MIEEAVWGLLPVCLVVLGSALLWYASLRQQRYGTASPFARQTIGLTFAGWTVLLLGGVAVAVTTALIFAPIVLLAGGVVVMSAIVRYRKSEVQFLIWSLAESAQRGIPLERAARAFASERSGGIGSAGRTLAEYLDAAMPLSLAMARSRIWVPSEVQLAADVGEKTGTLGPSLQKAVEQSNTFDNTLGSILSKFFYLSCILFVLVSVVTFMMIKIVPIYVDMFEEFDLALPATTQLMMTTVTFVVTNGFVMIPLISALAIFAMVGILLYIGVPIQSVPLVRYVISPVDSVTVLHCLAIAVEQRQPIPDNLSLLSGLAQSPRSRRRLGKAVRKIENGMHWADAIERAGFISHAQNAVLRAAERAGNLAWALNEVADSTIRRSAQRVQAMVNFLFPICVVGFGLCVMFIAVGMLLPLFSLVGCLAS